VSGSVTSATSVAADAPRSGIAARFLLFITAYFVLQAALRLLAVDSLGLDDAEMVVITQDLAVGYGSQPPLYNWLQMGAFWLFGFGAPAIDILHFVLLWAVYVLMFLSARIVLADELKAAVVALGLFAIPQIGWEALHSHTHTLLSLTLAAATLLAMLRVMDTGSWGRYLVLAVCFALGALAKYSYIPFAVALLVAAATLPEMRRRVLSLRMAAAIVLALILVGPHLYWVWTHLAETLSRTAKFKIDDDAGLVFAWGRGFVAMAVGVAGYVGLSLAVFAAAAFLPIARATAPAPVRPGLPEGRAFILRTLAVALGLVLVAVLATRATEVKERWLQPVLFVLPLALMIVVEPRLNVVRAQLLAWVMAGIGVVLMAALAVVYLVPDLAGAPLRANAPFAAFAADIRELGFEDGTILAENHYIAGNLKLHMPNVTVAEPEYGLWPVPAGGRTAPVLLAWSGKRDRPPEALRELYERLCGADGLDADAAPTRLREPYQHARKQRFELAVVAVPPCTPGGTP
jgi:4-amino-4-deoxy-L-arabinose transferase-like glycosyltransferase